MPKRRTRPQLIVIARRIVHDSTTLWREGRTGGSLRDDELLPIVELRNQAFKVEELLDRAA